MPRLQENKFDQTTNKTNDKNSFNFRQHANILNPELLSYISEMKKFLLKTTIKMYTIEN